MLIKKEKPIINRHTCTHTHIDKSIYNELNHKKLKFVDPSFIIILYMNSVYIFQSLILIYKKLIRFTYSDTKLRKKFSLKETINNEQKT